MFSHIETHTLLIPNVDNIFDDKYISVIMSPLSISLFYRFSLFAKIASTFIGRMERKSNSIEMSKKRYGKISF